MKKFLLGLLCFLCLVIATLYLTGYGYILKAVAMVYGTGHTTTFLDDYTYFDNRTIAKSSAAQPWAISLDYNKTPETPELQNAHQKYGTVAFLIIKGDSIWHEQYFDNYNSKSMSNSFSMAKSYVSALLGRAIADGYIKSLDQKVSDFFPEYKEGLAAQLTVGDLSSMASGLDWDESYYNPFSITTRAYFDKEFREKMLHLKITSPPGKSFEYLSGNTFLLGMVLEKATGKTLLIEVVILDKVRENKVNCLWDHTHLAELGNDFLMAALLISTEAFHTCSGFLHCISLDRITHIRKHSSRSSKEVLPR